MTQLTALALCLLLTSSYALLTPKEKFKGTDDLLDTVLTGDHEIYVLFFYSSIDMQKEGN
jgi:hypothetical protein